MSGSQAVLMVGGWFVIISAMIAVMVRMNRRQRERIHRRREAWKAAGNEGYCPGDSFGGTDGGGDFPPGGP